MDSDRDVWCQNCDIGDLSSGICPNCGGDFGDNFEPPSPAETLAFWDEASPSTAEDSYEFFDRILSYIVSATSEDQLAECGIPRPAAKSYVESIPSLQITPELLAEDPILICAVCKEEFLVHSEAKKLLCGHIYHPDCILPWLSCQSSCPVCRFRLPAEIPHKREFAGAAAAELEDDQVAGDVREIHRMLMAIFPGRNMSSVEDTDTLPDLRLDFLGIDPILRRIAARHRLTFSGGNAGDGENSRRGSRGEEEGDLDGADATISPG